MAALPIFATLEPLEKLSIYTPLGIRFWDPATATPVVDGLEVIARPPDEPNLARRAFRTRTGIYGFQNLPGQRRLEAPDPNLPAGQHPDSGTFPPVPFVVEVHDRLGRFLDVALLVDVPHRGLFPTPTPAVSGFTLVSRSSRPTPGEVGVVRAQLVERLGPGQFRPASHAVLQVQASGVPLQVGISGEDGSVVVFFPYPAFDAAVRGGSPALGGPESRLQGWDVTARVRYRPAAQTKPDQFARPPDLGALMNQPFARLWPDQAGPGQLQRPARLVYSQPLLLETAGRKELWVEVV